MVLVFTEFVEQMYFLHEGLDNMLHVYQPLVFCLFLLWAIRNSWLYVMKYSVPLETMLGEVSHVQKDKICMFSFICGN
jgi:hypothetical protein